MRDEVPGSNGRARAAKFACLAARMRNISRIAILALLTGCASHSPAPASVEPANAGIEHELKALRTELHGAMAQGNRQKLEQLLDESFLFVHSTGRAETRTEFIDRTVEAAAQNRVPTLEFAEDQIRVISGSTAIWISKSSRSGTSMSFIGTDVLARRGATWKWLSVQSTRTDRQ